MATVCTAKEHSVLPWWLEGPVLSTSAVSQDRNPLHDWRILTGGGIRQGGCLLFPVLDLPGPAVMLQKGVDVVP